MQIPKIKTPAIFAQTHSNSSAIRLKAVHGETLILQVLMSFVTVQKIIRIPKVQVQQLSV